MNKHTKDVHHHDHGGIFGKKTDLYFSILCGFFLLIGFILEKTTSTVDWSHLSIYIIAYFCGGYFISIEATQKISKGGSDIDFLMIAAEAGAAYIGTWAEDALLLFLVSLGHALESDPMNKATTSVK